MPNPFLVIGAVAVGVITATVGVLSVPGWVNAAHDSAAISDLQQVAVVQSASSSTAGEYMRTVSDLSSGFHESTHVGVEMQRTEGVPILLTVSEDATRWCAAAKSKSGAYFARTDASTDTRKGATLAAAQGAAGCDSSWKPSADSELDSPTPEPAVPPPYPGFAAGVLNPGGVITAGANTVITSLNWPTPPLGSNQVTCGTIGLTGDTPTPAPWSFTIKRGTAPFYTASSFWYRGSSQAAFAAEPSEIRVTGVGSGSGFNASWNNKQLSSERAITVEFCTNVGDRPAIVYGEQWYSVEQTNIAGWTATRACVTLTARGKVDAAEYPFLYGWAGTFDLRAAKKHIVDAGKTVNHVEFNSDPSAGHHFRITTDDSRTPALDRYDIASGPMLALQGSQVASVNACVNGY